MTEKKLPDFNTLLAQYEGEILFQKLVGVEGREDEIVYTVATNQGPYLILETDYLSSFKYLIDTVKEISHINIVEFVRVKQPKDDFHDYPQLKHVLVHQSPVDFAQIKPFLGYQGSSHDYYYNLLVKIPASASHI